MFDIVYILELFMIFYFMWYILQEFYKFLPEHGLASSNIIHEAELYKTMSEFSFYDGRVSGVIFADVDEEHRALLQKVSK